MEWGGRLVPAVVSSLLIPLLVLGSSGSCFRWRCEWEQGRP
jgi:hypothetical protein